MDVFECVSTLSSIRSYIDKEVSDEIIFRVLEAGRLAPIAHNDQPWRFILIKDKNKLNELTKYCISGSFINQVGFAVAILTDSESKWCDIDGTRAVQNMVLTAWSLDLGSCWIGRIDEKGLKNFLNIPDRWKVLTVLPFGYFNRKLIPNSKFRMSSKEAFYLDSYGNTFN